MPVTFEVAGHPSNPFQRSKVASSHALLDRSCPSEARNCKRIIQCSVPEKAFEESHISASNNGFVGAAYHAYNQHHHLTIRPDDIWFAILSQLNFYVNANAEQLREHFVAHEGKKTLKIVDVGSIDTYDFGVFARRMTSLLDDNIKDRNFRDWIMPTFSTTKVDDRTVAAVLMMGTLQAYFKYGIQLLCGIPSVTLLGEPADYEDILQRIDKLEELGPEPTDWAKLLRPVLRRFIASFDENKKAERNEFWSKIAERNAMSGGDQITGWINAFCYWTNDGKSIGFRPNREVLSARQTQRCWGHELDGVEYHRVKENDVPCGFASVPVKVDDNGIEYSTKMVAGSLGIQASESGNKGEGGEKKLDSVRSLSGWYMYELNE